MTSLPNFIGLFVIIWLQAKKNYALISIAYYKFYKHTVFKNSSSSVYYLLLYTTSGPQSKKSYLAATAHVRGYTLLLLTIRWN
jgi:hypothetical protein